MAETNSMAVRLTQAEMIQLKKIATARGRSKTQVLRDAFEQYAKQWEKENKQ